MFDCVVLKIVKIKLNSKEFHVAILFEVSNRGLSKGVSVKFLNYTWSTDFLCKLFHCSTIIFIEINILLQWNRYLYNIIQHLKHCSNKQTNNNSRFDVMLWYFKQNAWLYLYTFL